MSKGKKTELQTTIQSQSQWEELLQREGLIVVDAYSAWCGPCKAIVSTLKRIKNELGDDLLHFAIAETDQIDSLTLYRGKSQPTFLFYCNGVLVYVIRGCNCPVMIKTITSQLDKEHKVLEGKAERDEFIDEVVGAKPEAKKGDEKMSDIEDEEIEIQKEVSLAIIKPDAVKAGLVDEIIAKVKSEGMEILRQEERTLTKEEAAEFYKQHEGSEHFENLVDFMSSGPCMTLIISKGETGEGVIPEFRDLIGPKDVNQAKEEAPNSIRAVYGTSSVMNAIHACDTSESAARELAFFFPNFVSPTVKTKKASKDSNQRTLALIRPDALRHHKDEILEKVKEAGFSIAMAKEVTLTREEAEDFYAEHRGKDFFELLVQNMCSGPVMALCLAKDDAVEGWRNLLGPKEIDVAKVEAPESLRAQFHVEESDINPLHGSNSRSAARREIEKIFPVETTVAVIKPETAEESGDQIINRIKEAGFRIISRKNVGLTKELAGQFYHEHEGKDFFGGLTDYMSSGQSTVLLLEREDAVTGWRALMGPTDPEEAREKAPDSIRAVFGKDICRNAVHGSSNMDKAGHVIGELFPEIELLPNGKVNTMRGTVDDGEVIGDKTGGNQDDGGDQGRPSEIDTTVNQSEPNGTLSGDGTPRTNDGDTPRADNGGIPKADDGDTPRADNGGTPRADDGNTPGAVGGGTPRADDGGVPRGDDIGIPRTDGGDATVVADPVDGHDTTNTDDNAKEKQDGEDGKMVDTTVAEDGADISPGSGTIEDNGSKPDEGAAATSDTTIWGNDTTTNDNITTENISYETKDKDQRNGSITSSPNLIESGHKRDNTNGTATEEQPGADISEKPGEDITEKPAGAVTTQKPGEEGSNGDSDTKIVESEVAKETSKTE